MKMKKNQKGFTLIELLIVVAIIAILAAIAIPQFAQYRVRGFNSAAVSDLRNCRTSQEALFTDWRRYGRSEAAALPGAGGFGAGVYILGPGTAAAPTILTTTDAVATPRGMQIAIGNNVTLAAHTNAAAAGVVEGASYTIGAKHNTGDTTYAADIDSTAVYRNVLIGTPNQTAYQLGSGGADLPVATVGVLDLTVALNWAEM